MTLTEEQIRMMKEDITAELVEILVEKEGMTVEQGLDVVYESDTFEKLMDTDTGLYCQSTGYVYSFLEHELRWGRMD